MANSFQTSATGKAELKDYYDEYDSTYEALKKRRKRAADKEIIPQVNNEGEFDKVPKPGVR